MIEWLIEYIYLDDAQDSGYSYAITFAPTRARAAQKCYMLTQNANNHVVGMHTLLVVR